jgi:hypothetical protein
MDERPDQIKEHIDRTRGDLNENLNELQHKVKRAFDWRVQFEERPMTMLGLAFGGGILAAAMIPSGRRHRYYVNGETRRPFRNAARGSRERVASAVREEPRKTRDSLDALKGALISVAAGKIGAVLGDFLSRYRDQGGRDHRAERRERDERYSSYAGEDVRH